MSLTSSVSEQTSKYLECTKGDDSPCISKAGSLSQDSCCAYVKVEEMPETQALEFLQISLFIASQGIVPEKGFEKHQCILSSSKIKERTGENDTFEERGYKIKIYCDSAIILGAFRTIIVAALMYNSF